MYYYTRNGQGDIIGIIDNTGTVIARYIYDAWGDLEKITDGNGVGKTMDTSFIGYKNPFRYRGYFYDSSTGLYNCLSRYYDPVTGRFLNADVYASTGQGFTGYNMYAYCGNNPVVREDICGEFWSLIDGLIGIASVYVGDVIDNISDNEINGLDVLKPRSSVGTYTGAAISGMIPGGGAISVIARPVINTVVKHSIDSKLSNERVNLKDAGEEFVKGLLGEILSIGLNNSFGKLKPQNYSSFRNQMTRRLPQITLTQQQTKKLMSNIYSFIDATIEIIEFATSKMIDDISV